MLKRMQKPLQGLSEYFTYLGLIFAEHIDYNHPNGIYWRTCKENLASIVMLSNYCTYVVLFRLYMQAMMQHQRLFLALIVDVKQFFPF